MNLVNPNICNSCAALMQGEQDNMIIESAIPLDLQADSEPSPSETETYPDTQPLQAADAEGDPSPETDPSHAETKRKSVR